jgi:hypothetical protein
VWLLHLPEIIEMLAAFDVPVVDRAIIERLFGLRRRRAIELLHRFGGYQAGRTFLIERRTLIEHLQHLAEGEEFQVELRRRERLDGEIDKLRRYRAAASVRIPVRSTMCQTTALPAGVALQPGHLHIEFSSTEDLLAKLFELAQAAGDDLDRFRAAAEPAA